MKLSAFFSFVIAPAAIGLLTYCTNPPASSSEQTTGPAHTKETLTQRGEYLVGILGCHDCHSPKKMGPKGPELIPELMLSGYPSDRPFGKVNKEALAEGWALFNGDLTAGVGPWGATFAANITSDASGIGEWSLEQFTRALTQGKAKGLEEGRPLLPPMPWFNYTNMKPEDIEAIFTYLQSTKPVRNVVPAPIGPEAL
jgi:mono/diheme cytochrome c family protein